MHGHLPIDMNDRLARAPLIVGFEVALAFDEFASQRVAALVADLYLRAVAQCLVLRHCSEVSVSVGRHGCGLWMWMGWVAH